MDLQTLTTFFKLCTLITAGVFVLAVIFFKFAPDFVYRLHSNWFPVPRETYNVIIYTVLMSFKILFLIFFVIPYVALLIMG